MQIKKKFEEILDPLGKKSADFFMAASLYYAKKISFSKAASLSNLSFEAFLHRLEEYFGKGFMIDDDSVLEDIEAVIQLQTPAS